MSTGAASVPYTRVSTRLWPASPPTTRLPLTGHSELLMVISLEISPPFRWVPRLERRPGLVRLVAFWFAVSYVPGKLQDLVCAVAGVPATDRPVR